MRILHSKEGFSGETFDESQIEHCIALAEYVIGYVIGLKFSVLFFHFFGQKKNFLK